MGVPVVPVVPAVPVLAVDERPEPRPTGPTQQLSDAPLGVEDVDDGVDVTGFDGRATAAAVVGTTDHAGERRARVKNGGPDAAAE